MESRLKLFGRLVLKALIGDVFSWRNHTTHAYMMTAVALGACLGSDASGPYKVYAASR